LNGYNLSIYWYIGFNHLFSAAFSILSILISQEGKSVTNIRFLLAAAGMSLRKHSPAKLGRNCNFISDSQPRIQNQQFLQQEVCGSSGSQLKTCHNMGTLPKIIKLLNFNQ